VREGWYGICVLTESFSHPSTCSVVAASLLQLNRQKQMNRAIRFSAIVHGSVLHSPDCNSVCGCVCLSGTNAWFGSYALTVTDDFDVDDDDDDDTAMPV